MKQLLLLCGVAFAANAYAQPTLQASDFNYTSKPGFVQNYKSSQTPVDPGAAGANVTWDFSTLSGATQYNYTTGACPGDPSCSNFPSANQVITNTSFSNSKTYYIKTATAVEQVGELGLNNQAITYSDPLKLLQFPMTYGQTYTDNHAETGTTAQGTFSLTGVAVSNVDGYGTLKTPKGTYSNVLRQKLVDTRTMNMGGLSYTVIITQHSWFAAGYHENLMTIIKTESIIPGSPVAVPPSYVTAYTDAPGSTSITDLEILQKSVTVYPNPASRFLQIKTDGLKMNSIKVVSILGQEVYSKSLANIAETRIDDIDFAAGNYFIKIQTEKGTVHKKVVIK